MRVFVTGAIGFISADNPVSSALAQELLGWRPMHPGLISDIEEGYYFNHE